MAFFERSLAELNRLALEDLVEKTNISQLSPGAKARAILESVNRRLNSAYKTFDSNLAQALLSGATGPFLDLLGDVFNVQRLQQEAAITTTGEQNLNFFVLTGTFGDINSNNNILIPAGTIISNEEITDDTTDATRYLLLEDVILPATSSQVFASAEAVDTGSSFNTAIDTLQFHNFTNYTDTANSTLKATNSAAIVTGKDIESDTNYKFRISQQTTSSEKANLTAIRLASLSVPGVADILIDRYARGIGTFDVIIRSIAPRVSSALVRTVQTAIDEVEAIGDRGLARAPEEVGLEIRYSLLYRENLADDDKALLEVATANAVEGYVNNLAIGEDFIINEVVQRVLEIDDRIKNIGQANKPLDDIFEYRDSEVQDNRVRRTLLGDRIAEANQRIIIEESIPNPIIVRSNN
jgi:hypothetical protein